MGVAMWPLETNQRQVGVAWAVIGRPGGPAWTALDQSEIPVRTRLKSLLTSLVEGTGRHSIAIDRIYVCS